MADRKLQQNNNGFSLIELIVVVMIMAVLAGGSLVGMSRVMNTSVQVAAEKLVKQLDRTRYENLYLEGEVSLRLQYEDGSFYAVNCLTKCWNEIVTETERQREELGGNRIDIYAVTQSGSRVDIRSTPVTICFDKSGGALKGEIYSSIVIENASKKAEITLVERTGRCFIN